MKLMTMAFWWGTGVEIIQGAGHLLLGLVQEPFWQSSTEPRSPSNLANVGFSLVFRPHVSVTD